MNELEQYLIEHNKYRICKSSDFDFGILRKIETLHRRAGGQKNRVNNIWIMADTETSKESDALPGEPEENYLVAWTISLRAERQNIVTLYGSDPEGNVDTLVKIHESMRGTQTVVYYHNLSYDWVFLRRFLIDRLGEPVHQLNTKPHYPIYIEFSNGLVLKDSLILAQRSLDKWSKDLGVHDTKALGKWDYSKVRKQGDDFTADERTYIEHDTLAGVECLEAMARTLGDTVATMPYTATGIVRRNFRKTARNNRGRQWFKKQAFNYRDVWLSEHVYHGGYTHANRYFTNLVTRAGYDTNGEEIVCYDIASSYPFALISEKYPHEKFVPVPDCKPEEIINASAFWGYLFIVDLYKVELKDSTEPMPILQYSKALETINEITDNGRILKADYVKIALCDVDLCLLAKQYRWNEKFTICKNVRCAHKEYLPRWFTDFVYNLFYDKTQLKGGDPVLYALAKSQLNSCYGMCCQHVMQNDIVEDYETGEFTTTIRQSEDYYEKYLNNRNSFLPYQIGIYCTAYAVKNLFELGSCIGKSGVWLYSDTDSCFAYGWDLKKVKAYNDFRIAKMTARGYEGIEHNGKMYYLGIVEKDKVCTEFKAIHSKCYCYRDPEGELHITVAGVPKKGVRCLNNDINNFRPGFIFRGTETGKLMHTYLFSDGIHTDKAGNRIGDSIDLSPCDYIVNTIEGATWEDVTTDEMEMVRTYED